MLIDIRASFFNIINPFNDIILFQNFTDNTVCSSCQFNQLPVIIVGMLLQNIPDLSFKRFLNIRFQKNHFLGFNQIFIFNKNFRDTKITNFINIFRTKDQFF